MSNYLEKFEKMRIAGSLASKTLAMITDYVKEGTATNNIDKLEVVRKKLFEEIEKSSLFDTKTFSEDFLKALNDMMLDVNKNYK